MADDAASGAGQEATTVELEQLRAVYAAALAEIAALREREAARAEEAARDQAALAESYEQQSAIADVLRVIASAPTDLQQVLDSLVESVARLVGATYTVLWRAEGQY